MAVDGSHGWSWVGEQTQVGGAVGVKPGVDLLERTACEQRKVMIEVEPGCEDRTGPGQHDRTIVELRLKTIEGRVEIGEEGRILRIDLVGVHGHDSHMRVPALDDPG